MASKLLPKVLRISEPVSPSGSHSLTHARRRVSTGLQRTQNSQLARLTQPRLKTHRWCTRNLSHGSLATSASLWPPSVSATIVTNLQKVNVRCTAFGLEALEKSYADTKYSDIFDCDTGWNRRGPSTDPYRLYEDLSSVHYFDSPYGISHVDLNAAGTRQWRSQRIFEACLDYKTFRLWEALYGRTELFKKMIDEEEADMADMNGWQFSGRHCLTSLSLWQWMQIMVQYGLVDRDDVENLPEPYMLRDVIPGSGGDPWDEPEDELEDESDYELEGESDYEYYYGPDYRPGYESKNESGDKSEDESGDEAEDEAEDEFGDEAED
ncbi:hypothetical protein ABW21_db0205735 [Orbilia brochopaga]|nr:hypothetical protein ABW21_db0205735 [Drechslerella brochopaga]